MNEISITYNGVKIGTIHYYWSKYPIMQIKVGVTLNRMVGLSEILAIANLVNQIENKQVWPSKQRIDLSS